MAQAVLRVLSLCLLIAVPSLSAQTEAVRKHNVAVALSGGGALGLAHIGVLKYLEEHHIPIELVAGTSMGGLVGGLYSTGISPAEMEKIALQVDWGDLINANPPFRNQPIVEKQYWNRPSGTFTLRLGHNFSLLSGVSAGESLALFFSRYTAAYADVASFDELPIPFRCVATDLVTTNRVVLSRGSLPKALRATMAVPGIFAPVEWGNEVLVDGGLVENLPVETAREMGAEVVIAVRFVGNTTKTTQFRTLGDVLRQTVSIPVIHNERTSAALADVVIQVQIGTISSTDFDHAAELIKRGYEAAQAQSKDLARFVVSPAQWESYLTARGARIRRLPAERRLVEIRSPQPQVESGARHDALRQLGTGPLQTHDLEHTIAEITSAAGLPGAFYEWQKQAGKPEGYGVDFLPRPSALFFLRPEILYQSSDDEPNLGTLRIGATMIPFNTYKSRFLGELNLGYDSGVRAEYHHPFDGTKAFLAGGIVVQQYHDNAYTATTSSSFQRTRSAASFRGGIGTGRFSQISIGVLTGYDSYSQPITTGGIPATSGSFTNLETAWTYNSQDSGGLPSQGTLLEGSFGYSFRRSPFPYLENHFSRFHPLNRRVSLFIGSDQESSFGKSLSFYDQFTYGGAAQLDAYRYQEFHANTLGSARAGVVCPIFKKRSWILDPRIAGWYEIARLDLGPNGWQTHQSSSAGVFLPTPIGPLGLVFSASEKATFRVRFSIGRPL